MSEAARLAHVSVRTLHHYDEIGLLTPKLRTGAGYRLYDDADLQRLHDILLYRELGFTLDAIQQLLQEPVSRRIPALREQRGRLVAEAHRTEAVIRAVDATLKALERGAVMNRKELFDGFDEFDHAQYGEEAEQRWGDTEAYRESTRRTKRYTKEDWRRIREEGEEIVARWAELHVAGREPTDAEVRAVVERHRRHIDQWFYPCDRAIHTGLAELYVSDARFADYFDRRGAGLSGFVAASIRAAAAAGP